MRTDGQPAESRFSSRSAAVVVTEPNSAIQWIASLTLLPAAASVPATGRASAAPSANTAVDQPASRSSWRLTRVVVSLVLVALAAGGYFLHRKLTAIDEEPLLQAYAAVHPIDVHVHVFKTDPAFQAMLDRLNLKLMNILVVDDTVPYRKGLQPQIKNALGLMQSSHGHIAFCTTFDPYMFQNPSFDADSIKQINRDFADGAVAVKIWKNIGMEIKNADGKFIMADDPKFEPIYKDIAEQGKTLTAHQAEPDVAWGPPDPSDPSWSYYQENPQWFLYNKAGFPSKQEILNARDNVLGENPNLRMVGAHLGSMEKSLENIATHLDRYPNFAVDMAARMEYLMMVPPEEVRAFLIKYQDRVLYGTDLDFLASAYVQPSLKKWESTYARDWRFLATDETFQSEGRTVQGLKLPQPVLKKIFHENAIHWIPGL